MSKRNYPRLSVEEFGRKLIETGDLDPVYIALTRTDLSESQRNRWLLAYWCFYHCGVASYLSEFEGQEFFDKMMVAAENTEPSPLGGRWPRASERRHFRGQQAIKAVNELRETYGGKPEDMVKVCYNHHLDDITFSFEEIAKNVKRHRGFGDWIAFKVADMLETCCAVPVDFTHASVFMFKDPVKGALMVWRNREGLEPEVMPKNDQIKGEIIKSVVDHLSNEFSDLKAPPSLQRGIGLQEVETVLCKWKSHMNGHYPVGNDTKEIAAGLSDWTTVCKTADKMLQGVPKP